MELAQLLDGADDRTVAAVVPVEEQTLSDYERMLKRLKEKLEDRLAEHAKLTPFVG